MQAALRAGVGSIQGEMFIPHAQVTGFAGAFRWLRRVYVQSRVRNLSDVMHLSSCRLQLRWGSLACCTVV